MNCWKRSFSAVSSRSGNSPSRTRAISASIWSRRFCSSTMRRAGSAWLPSLIWRSKSNSVSKRDSVPTKLRADNWSSQAMAFSVAGVRSNCGSSEPWS